MDTLILCVVLALAGAAAIVDLKTQRLPDVLTLPAAAAALVGFSVLGEWGHVVGGVAASFMLKITQLYCRHRHGKECIGSGDVKLIFSLGCLIGIQLLPLFFSLSFAFVCILLVLFKLQRQPFGPSLVASAIIALQHYAG